MDRCASTSFTPFRYEDNRRLSTTSVCLSQSTSIHKFFTCLDQYSRKYAFLSIALFSTTIYTDSRWKYLCKSILEIYRGPKNKRIFSEIDKLKQLESEGIFILDVDPVVLLNKGEPPPTFSNTTTIEKFEKDIRVIYGRILPRSEPYCRASFLVEITLSSDYPFKPPELRFLDPVYHPAVQTFGTHCCCWHFANPDSWIPTRSLTDLIRAVVTIVDRAPDPEHTTRIDCFEEYQSDRHIYNQKALQSTLLYGRPRYWRYQKKHLLNIKI